MCTLSSQVLSSWLLEACQLLLYLTRVDGPVHTLLLYFTRVGDSSTWPYSQGTAKDSAYNQNSLTVSHSKKRVLERAIVHQALEVVVH